MVMFPSSPSYPATRIIRAHTDMPRQVRWLDANAKEKGFLSVEEMFIIAPNVFETLSRHWRDIYSY
jgi:hypothetical protein